MRASLPEGPHSILALPPKARSPRAAPVLGGPVAAYGAVLAGGELPHAYHVGLDEVVVRLTAIGGNADVLHDELVDLPVLRDPLFVVEVEAGLLGQLIDLGDAAAGVVEGSARLPLSDDPVLDVRVVVHPAAGEQLELLV